MMKTEVFLSRTDLNSSVKMLNKDDSRIFAVGSSGFVQGLGYDGSIYEFVKTELPPLPNSAASYIASNIYQTDGGSYLYYSFGVDGIFVAQGDYVQSLIDTNSEVVATTIAKNTSVDQAFLVTLDQDGGLKILNGSKDMSGPYLWNTTPYNGEAIDADQNITLQFSDSYLDYQNISKGDLVFQDTNTSSAVSYNLTIEQDPSLGYIYKIDPDSNLTSGHSYMITIDGNITDMIGNRFNNAEDYNLSFSVN